MAKQVPLAEYLFTRLRQLGIESIHGVPGDYNLTLLDYIEPAGIHWVGSCNELNGGYASDGYARIKGIGTLITTFGVGELSAINAIAGAYAELVPLVHIVGTPTRNQQDSGALIHHTLLDGQYDHFAEMYRHVTVAQANLRDPRTSAGLIDYTLQQCIQHSRPVYIRVPVDVVSAAIPAAGLEEHIRIPRELSSSHADSAIAEIRTLVETSRKPMILIDGESSSYGILDDIDRFVKTTSWPTWTTSYGKGCIDEDLPNFHGIWRGSFTKEEHRAYIDSADLIVCFGPHFSGTNTYAYTAIPAEEKSIFVSATTVNVKGKIFHDLPAKSFMAVLDEKVCEAETKPLFSNKPSSGLVSEKHETPKLDPAGLYTQDHFYRVLNQWLRPGDIILAETGTAGHGCRDFRLPFKAHLLKPVTWLSIGYMLPASQGAALAQRELHKAGKWHQDRSGLQPRTILLIGDGSFQMTAQELSTIIREQLNILIILINNDGYTIERCIHGVDKSYNDVARWRYLDAPAFFGAATTSAQGSYHAQTTQIRTWEQLEQTFNAMKPSDPPMLRMVEVFMQREDAPEVLADMLQTQRARLAERGAVPNPI